MLKEVTLASALFVGLSLAPAFHAQTHPHARASKPTSDACQGPWRQIGFDGFKVGMRVPGGMECLRRSRDVKYTRKTAANEYAVQPWHGEDNTESRLHPAMVLEEVTVLIDRPTSVAKILADFTEAGQLCAAGCRVVGLTPESRPRFVLFPDNPTDEQRAWALRTASYTGRTGNLVPVIYFYWEQKQECPHFDSGSLDWPIVRFEFSTADVSFPGVRRRPTPPSQSAFPNAINLGCREMEPGLTHLGELRP